MPEADAVPSDPQAIQWKHDAPASVVVFLVALPLCLGVALASGAPLFAGIIAGILGGLVVAPLSGSALMVSGPAAGLTAIVLAAITQLGDYRAFLVAVVIGGAIQLALAALRAGIIGYYFPSAVIKGMLSAIGLVLILKQLPHAVGYDADSMGDETFKQANAENTFSGITHAFESLEPGAVIIALLSLVILFGWSATPFAKMRLFPAPLAVVALGTGLNAFFSTVAPNLVLGSSHLVTLPVPAAAADWLQQFAFPAWGAISNPVVWRVGVTLGIVASLETLLSLEATDKMDPYKREAPPNRELFAQGVGNMVSGLIGGLPLTGVIVRSAANVSAGARTRWSAILHGVLLVVAVVAVPRLLNLIPLAALAAILLHTGFKLAHPSILKGMVRLGKSQWVPYVITVAAILFTDLLVGIAIGMTVGIFIILRDTLSNPPFTVVSPKGANLARWQLHDHVNFLNKAALLKELDSIPAGSRVEIDGRLARRVDADALEALHQFSETAQLRGIDYRLVAIPARPDRLPARTERADFPQAENELVKHYQKLLQNNADWAREMVAQDPDFFSKREQAQTPHHLIIGCSDSRVPLELMTGALPGEMFVHRNIGNQVWETDMNIQGVIQFAVDVLDVEHIIVCGHSNCGALKAASAASAHGLLDHWLSDIRSTIRWNRAALDVLKTPEDRLHRLSHLNVLQQVGILSRTPTILDAWSRGKRPMLHGWVYDIGTGLIERVIEQVDSAEKAAELLPRN